MTLKDWFAAKQKNNKHLKTEAVNARMSDAALCALWTQCFKCQVTLPTKDLKAAHMVCTECGYHFRIGARERIAMLTEQFDELDAGLTPADPLGFSDTQPYVQRQQSAQKKTKLNEAIVTGIGAINGQSTAIGIMDFSFMGGAMGSVVGEKITRLAETALAKQLPLVLFCASGGARMQEGTFSLMQMVKTSAALARFHDAGLLYITVLSEPTFGGVTASFGMLGDVIIAEQGARIGFAGRRVIEQTIRQKLPADFQTANYLLQYGQVDMVVKRHDMKQRISELIRLHVAAETRYASAQSKPKVATQSTKTPKALAHV